MIGPLTQVLLVPSLNPLSRALVVETLEKMQKGEGDQKKNGLMESKKLLPPLLRIVDVKDVDEALKLRVGDILCTNMDPAIEHQAIDLTSHGTPAGRKVGIRLLKAISTGTEGATSDVVTNRLYVLLEDPDEGVTVEALLALLAIGDDYAAQVLKDFVQAGDHKVIAEVLSSISKPISRETFDIVLDAILLENVPVQEALRRLLPDLSQGGFAEDIRQRLVSLLKALPGGRSQPGEPAAAPLAPVESSLGQGKIEFKFKREHTQELTVLFVDIADSTEKSTRLDMSILIKIIKAFEEIVTSTIAANRGSIVKKMGDGILAVFKTPYTATIAALEIQKKIRDYSAVRVEQEKFEARVGLNTGPVIRRDNDIFGETVNVASRMQSVAGKGDVVLTQGTFEEVHEYVRCTSMGKVNAKGIKDPIMAYVAKEVTKNPSDILKNAEGADARDASLEKLKESMFVPSFQAPPEKKEQAELVSQLESVFSDLTRFVEELAPDYRLEYDFKKYLQDRWNALLDNL